jgi:hypothetical protein
VLKRFGADSRFFVVEGCCHLKTENVAYLLTLIFVTEYSGNSKRLTPIWDFLG